MATKNEIGYSKKKLMELVLNRFLKKYDWFKKIEIDSIGYSEGGGGHFTIDGGIFVDEDWLYNQWREYYYSAPFPDLNYKDLGDFIGGDLAKKLRDEFIMIFVIVTELKKPRYMTWIRIRTEEEDDQNLKESMKTRQITKQILVEETKLSPYIRRRLTSKENEIINQLKKEVLNNSKSGKTFLEIINKSCMDAAYEFLDRVDEWRDLPQKESVIILRDLSQLIFEKYGDIAKEFINNFFDEKNEDEDRYVYIFHKHGNSNGTGNGFSDSFATWNSLVRRFGRWFVDLNWNQIKSKLDEKDGQTSILIKSPGDENNNMGYYFSVRKHPRR